MRHEFRRALLYRRDPPDTPLRSCMVHHVEPRAYAWVGLFGDYRDGHAPPRDVWTPLYRDAIRSMKTEYAQHDQAVWKWRRKNPKAED